MLRDVKRHAPSWLLSWVLPALCAGCAHREEPADLGPDLAVAAAERVDQHQDLAPRQDLAAGEVTGSAIDTYILASGQTARPQDLSSAAIAALVQRPDGSFATYPGAGRADGSFSIGGVPAGTYYLRHGSTYVVTAARSVDLGADHMGRKGAAQATNQTDVTLHIDGLSAWQAGDELQLFSAETAAYGPRMESNLDPALPAGATFLHHVTLDWRDLVFPPALLDGPVGDQAYLYQLTTRQSDKGLGYRAISRSLVLPAPLQLREGKPSTLSGALADTQQTGALALDLRISRFSALIPAASPKATESGAYFYLDAGPGAGTRGVYDSTADLLVLELPPQAGDTSTGTMTYGDPFPASWGRYGNFGVSFSVPYTAPGARRPTLDHGSISAEQPLSALGAAVVPLVTPVQAPLINGHDAFADLRGVGLTPTVHFGVPAGAGWVQVRVCQVGSAFRTVVATILAREGDLTLPPGVLQGGQAYYLSLTAIADAGSGDPGAHPLRRTLPHASADAFTGMFTP